MQFLRFMRSNPTYIGMPIILAIGFGIRLIGINVGLPDAPDPREVLIAADVLNLIHLTAPPQIYNWPGTTWFYIIAAIGKLLSLGGLHLTETNIILLARCINTILSTTTLWFTYRIGFHCYNRRVGQLAAGLLAVAMLHATNESRFALVDIPATFCVTLFLWLVTRARFSSPCGSKPHLHTAIWLGIIAGIGFAVKFTTIFVGLSLIAFIGSKFFYRRLATILCVSALTFTCLCPYWLIDLLSSEWNLFFQDFWYEATHYHRGHFGLITTAESGWLSRFIYLWTLLKWGMGVPLALLVSLGILYALVSLKRSVGRFPILEASLLAFVIPYLLFIGIHKIKFARHLLILYPVLTVLAAVTLTRLPITVRNVLQWIRSGSAEHARTVEKRQRILNIFQKWFGGILGGIIAVYSLIYTVSFAAVMLSTTDKDRGIRVDNHSYSTRRVYCCGSRSAI